MAKIMEEVKWNAINPPSSSSYVNEIDIGFYFIFFTLTLCPKCMTLCQILFKLTDLLAFWYVCSEGSKQTVTHQNMSFYDKIITLRTCPVL